MRGLASLGSNHLLFGTDMPYDTEFGDRTLSATIMSIDRKREKLTKGIQREFLFLDQYPKSSLPEIPK
jgi:hypothetical protein